MTFFSWSRTKKKPRRKYVRQSTRPVPGCFLLGCCNHSLNAVEWHLVALKPWVPWFSNSYYWQIDSFGLRRVQQLSLACVASSSAALGGWDFGTVRVGIGNKIEIRLMMTHDITMMYKTKHRGGKHPCCTVFLCSWICGEANFWM